MATIKSFTDLSQSKKLAEILPLESADMLWEQHGTEPYVTVKPWTTRGKSIGCHCFSCWSLAALYGILPNNKKESTTLSRGGWNIESIEYIDNWWCEYEDESHTKDFAVSADNPVDACYEVIIKLYELKIL